MRAAAVLLLLGLAPGVARGEPAPVTRARVEIVASNATPFVNEPIRLALQFGIDRTFFENRAVQLFRTELDVPVQVRAPWVAQIPGTTMQSEPAADGSSGLRFALNGRAGRAQPVDVQMVAGRAYDIYRVERIVRPTRAGTIELSAPTLRFAHATKFEEDFVGGRVPLDRKDVTIQGAPLTLQVRALPTAGRPPAFVDAVGHFEIAAELDAEAVDVGETFHLRVHITGEGNLEALTLPDIRGLPGLHVYAMRDRVEDDTRTLRAEVAVTDATIDAVPPISFAYFDPGPPAGYVVVHTQPQPLRVNAVEDAPRAPTPSEPASPTPDGKSTALWMLAVALALGLGIWLAWRRRASRAPGESADPPRPRDPLRIDAAQHALGQAASASPHEQSDALAECVAAHLGCAPAAVIDPDLVTRLVGDGLSPDDARTVADALEGLVASRYGGPAVRVDPSRLRTLLAGLSR